MDQSEGSSGVLNAVLEKLEDLSKRLTKWRNRADRDPLRRLGIL